MKKAAQATPNKYLVSERLKYRWSQKDVADRLGTTRINVNRWERGTTTPGPYFRKELAQLFQKSEVELGLLPSAFTNTRVLFFKPKEMNLVDGHSVI